jgi:sugar O-acyltransferase (sialic acid O-acetyltransferase NeuD family)
MEDIYIFGASGYARETALINQEIGKYTLKAFVDKENTGISLKIKNQSFPVISENEFIGLCSDEKQNAIIAISAPKVVQKIISRFKSKCFFPNLIHPSAIISGEISLGIGNIITYNCSFTDNITIGSFNRFNIGVTVGHDVIIGNNNQFNPSCNISGNIEIGDNDFFGVNSVILQGVKISDNIVIGASSLVIRNITKPGTYVGTPASELLY